jgi:hypothetical protein
MKIMYAESAWNSVSSDVLIERKKRVHKYLVRSQMKHPLIKWFVSGSVRHYNSNWEQNQYHIRNQRKRLHRIRYFWKSNFCGKNRPVIPLSSFLSKNSTVVPYRLIFLKKIIFREVSNSMQFFMLIPNMILILFSIRVIMTHRVGYESDL